MSFKLLPKIELHIHLDCSLSYNVVKKLRPETSIQDYNQNFKAGESCSSLKHYIKCADNAISLMQTKESLELVMEDFLCLALCEGVPLHPTCLRGLSRGPR